MVGVSVKPWIPNLEKKNKKRFGKSKNFTYLCTTKEIDNNSDTNLKKK